MLILTAINHIPSILIMMSFPYIDIPRASICNIIATTAMILVNAPRFFLEGGRHFLYLFNPLFELLSLGFVSDSH
jgi:hypothetical protein